MTDLAGDTWQWAYACEVYVWETGERVGHLCQNLVRWRTPDRFYFCDEHKR